LHEFAVSTAMLAFFLKKQNRSGFAPKTYLFEPIRRTKNLSTNFFGFKTKKKSNGGLQRKKIKNFVSLKTLPHKTLIVWNGFGNVKAKF
jgi:low affinity Fe/Cu permease